ncbi:unnamed protein product [Vitrella brassicaformis CCMP3155]|uniref:Uncharacterized protein n=1 Tax=Vitrella brassicaformis (strain CCMP3155) TaxID=1169540 RepID=A0A0G4FRM9_VITBC|nr:unnamed protein product [Vitrella brassicaformis CCMP3155]|eukprot:CEM17320.1 unnamed protein product [Vitrella brassicaformis CCMP3155]
MPVMASSTRGMHGLARLPSDLWVLNLSGTLTDKETMRLSVLDESCFESICSSTLVIGPAVPRLRRVLLCSHGPQKIILVVAKGKTSLAADVLQFFIDAMRQHGDKIKTIKSVQSAFDERSNYWDTGRVGLRGTPRTFPLLTDIDVGLVPVVKAFRHFDWKTPNLKTLKARVRWQWQPLLDLTQISSFPGGFQQSLSHMLAQSPLIRHIDVFPLSTLVCGTALDTRADSLEAVGDMVFITHDQEMEGFVAGLPSVQPPATSKRIGIFDRNLAFESTLPASYNPAGRTFLQLLVELQNRGYCALPKGRLVELKGAPESADVCPAAVEGSIRDIVKRAICQAETIVMSYGEQSQPWDDSWELTGSSGRLIVFDKTKHLIIKCLDTLRGYVGHDAIAGWTAGGWTRVEVLTLERVELQSVKDHVSFHKHRFTAEGVYEKPLPPQLPMTQQHAAEQAAYAAAGVPTPVRPPPPTNHYVLSDPLQRLLKTMPPTLHTVRLIDVPWWAAFHAFVCLSEGTAAQPGEGGTKRVCLDELEVRTEVQDSPLVVPEKGGALWSAMQERLSFFEPLTRGFPSYTPDHFRVYYDLILMLQANAVVLTVNTSLHAKPVLSWSDDGADIEPNEAKYPFLKGFTGDIRTRYRMCHCGARGDYRGHTDWTDGRMDVVLKRRRLGDLSGLAADKCAMQ